MRTKTAISSLTFYVFLSALSVGYFFLGGTCWEYSINNWRVWSGREPDFTVWLGGIISFLPGVGQLGPLAAAVTFVASFFVGG